jgi:alkylation response protein AidB-like acyl-CoA dehydrogenase
MIDATLHAHPASTHPSAYFREEHELLRRQVRRFVDTEIKPFAGAWELQGFVPRETLRAMGRLGFLGIRYPQRRTATPLDFKVLSVPDQLNSGAVFSPLTLSLS